MARNKAKRFEVQTDIDWAAIVAQMEQSSWEENVHDTDQEIRQVCLGTQMGLSPSGKYYQPWASGNLLPCFACGGSGRVTLRVPNRRAKKARKRLEAIEVKMDRLISSAKGKRDTWVGVRRFNVGYANDMREKLDPLACGNKHCERCDGEGSHEAAADERFWEKLDAEAQEHGFFIDHSEDGDSVFVAELRQKDEDEFV